jgi:cell division protease FtsH
MVIEYGMSEKLGPLRFAADAQNQYLGASGHLDSSISTTTAALVEAETSRIVREALEKALHRLKRHTPSLETLMHRLCEEETVSGEEIKTILEDEETAIEETVSSKVVSFTTEV